jgi:hypothetical protein
MLKAAFTLLKKLAVKLTCGALRAPVDLRKKLVKVPTSSLISPMSYSVIISPLASNQEKGQATRACPVAVRPCMAGLASLHIELAQRTNGRLTLRLGAVGRCRFG